MNKKLIVYTTLFSSYDELIEPKGRYENCDFVCFTDRKDLRSNIWEIRLVENIDLPSNMLNRKYKILTHLFFPDYEWSLYVDMNITIIGNPYELAQKYLTKFNFVLPKHFKRNCIYEEAKECVIVGKVDYYKIKQQVLKYKKEGFPKNFGLGENGILLRRHNEPKVIKIMEDWWHELNIYTQRDQLSLGYVLWKNQEKFNFMDESSRNNTGYFKWTPHNKDKRNFWQFIRYKFFIVRRRIFYFLTSWYWFW